MPEGFLDAVMISWNFKKEFRLERRIVLLYVISPMRVPLKLLRSDM